MVDVYSHIAEGSGVKVVTEIVKLACSIYDFSVCPPYISRENVIMI